MNNKELSYFEELVLDLFKDQDAELKVELDKQIEKEVIQLTAEYNIEPSLKLLVVIDEELERLHKDRIEIFSALKKIIEDLYKKYFIRDSHNYQRIPFNSEDVKNILKQLAEHKVKGNLENYSFGSKMKQLEKDKKEATLALRLVSTRTEVREFLAMMYEKFGKKLPI